MSDEQLKHDQSEVEGHVNGAGANEEPAGEDETDVEAHVRRRGNARMDSPSNT